MRRPYRPRKPKSSLSLRDIRCAVHDVEVACEDAGILLGRAHHASERDAFDLRRRAREQLAEARHRLACALVSLDEKLSGIYASQSARNDFARAHAAFSQTEPTGDRSPATSSKVEGPPLTAPAVASHGGGQ